MDYENLIQVNQAEVAEQVGMNRHNVNRSIKKLIELGVVLEGVKIGVSRSYRLNPNFGWKGSAKGHREALHEHLKIVKQPVGSWRADEPSPHRLHRCTHYTLCQTVRSYKTITPKMSAFGTSTPTTRPLGACQKPWALPTPAFARAGVQATPTA